MHEPLLLLDGTKVVIRPPAEQDAPVIQAAIEASRNEISPWMAWCHDDYGLAEVKTWIQAFTAEENEYAFVVFDESEQLCLGSCGLNDLNERHHFANLGYWVRSSHVGRGIATAATTKVAEYAFSQLNLVRVEIVAALGNYASQRVAIKAGAKREGILRNGLVHGDRVLDAVIFSLVPADLR